MFKNKKFTNRIPFSSVLALSLLVLFAAMFSQPLYAKTRYVSDELTVPLRSGPSNQHRILKFLSSGTALTVVAASEDGKYTNVEIGGDKSGWVLTENLMDIPSGRDRLAAANKKFENSFQEIKDLKNTIAELRAEIKALKNENSALQGERTNLNNSLEDLKITAANPLMLSKKNRELKQELDEARANEAMLEKDNQQLRNNVMQEWFIIGGGFAIGSMLLGIILTRINWRRKRNSWGDSF